MIANGMTTQAVKVLFHGKRQTLIPPGKPVPAVAQYWNSDPRPQLILYRGPGGTEGEEHLLGHFEVLYLPPSDDLNVSTLCVVADRRIILCARDNSRELFLEMRRVADEALKR